ncbi:MAG: LLM class flavin-dependent oxidoreductase [Microbacterium sp.]
MKFLASTLIDNSPDPITGVQKSATERLDQVVANAVFAEEYGFDAYGVGERHAQRFLSSSPPVILAAIAQATGRIRLVTTVTVLSLLDPVRVAEDYATLDHLSHGRVDIIIGKGNDPEQNALFGYELEGQWERNREKYELLRRLLREEEVTWSGAFRPPLHGATTRPRPFQQPLPVWHGSASSRDSTELAARFGDPLFSANGFHPLRKYADLVDHYREQWVAYGHDPKDAVVGAGSGGLFVTRNSQEARSIYGPIYERFLRSPAAQHNRTPFTDLEDVIRNGPALIGSVAEVRDKIGRYHEALGHEVLSLSLEDGGLTGTQRRESLDLFFAEIAPELRRDYPSKIWKDAEPAAYPDPGAVREVRPTNGVPGPAVIG